MTTASVPTPVRFTALQRQHLKHLASELNRKVGSAYEVHFDETDFAKEWAMFMQHGDGVLQVLAGAGEDGLGHVLVDAEGQLVSTPAGTLNYASLIPQARKFLRNHWRMAQADEGPDAPMSQGQA